MPAGMPISSAMTSATPVTERSTGSPVAMLLPTGTPENQETPKSPWIALPIQLKYWAKKPRSRPIAWFRWAIAAGVALSPSFVAAGLDGEK